MNDTLSHPHAVLYFIIEVPGVVTKDAPDVLDKQKCLDALASLRHAKWFQVCYVTEQGGKQTLQLCVPAHHTCGVA